MKQASGFDHELEDFRSGNRTEKRDAVRHSKVLRVALKAAFIRPVTRQKKMEFFGEMTEGC